MPLPSPYDSPPRADAGSAPAQARLLLSQASGFLKGGDLPACQQALERALERAPGQAEILAFLGNVLLLRGRPGEARQRLEASLALKPDRVPVLTRLAAACMATGDSPAFQAALGQALSLQPNDLESLRLLAGFRASRGFQREAIDACRSILRQDPRDATTLVLLGQSQQSLGEYPEAKKAYLDLLALQPNDPSAAAAVAGLGTFLPWAFQGGQSQRSRAASPFVRFQALAAERPDRFPGVRARLAWMEFRKLFHSLTFGAIWAATPASFDEWKSDRVSPSRYAPILEWLAGTDGAIAFDPAESLSMPEAFGRLDLLHDRIRFELNREAGAWPVRSLAAPVGAGASPRQAPGRPEATDELSRELQAAPPSIRATLRDGGRADVFCLVDRPQVGGGTFWEAAQWLFQLHHSLFALDPWRHRGPRIAFASEIDGAAAVDFSPEVICRGVWHKGGEATVRYHDGIVETAAAVGALQEVFETRLVSASDFRSPFHLGLWAESAFSLPLLLPPDGGEAGLDLRDGSDGDHGDLPEGWQATLQGVAAVQAALGRWTAEQPAAETRLDRAANPGLAHEAQRLRLLLTAPDLRGLGLSDVLVTEVRRIWENVRDRTLRIAAHPAG
jgi:tetratricopeptide (TPR) repeat protein